MEIEAKFIVLDGTTYEELKRCQTLAGYNLQAPKRKSVTDSYLDTPQLDIFEAGYALRKRVLKDRIVMSLKGRGGAEGAIHRREELEVELPLSAPAEGWQSGPVYERVAAMANPQRVNVLCQLTQERLVRYLIEGERLVAECSLDEVTVLAGQRFHFFELEIELTGDGTEADLSTLATHLQTDWRLEPSSLSKLERALSMLKGA